MAAPRRSLDPELAAWRDRAFRPASVEIPSAVRREAERRAIVRAIESSPNLDVAARRLGASRRTLLNRKHEYGLPAGQSGRPRALLPQSAGGKVGVVIAGAAALGVGFLVGRWWMRRRKQQPQSIFGSYVAGTRALASW